MFKKALLLAIATTVMAGCGTPAGSSFVASNVASNGPGLSADAAKAVTASEQSKADSLLDKVYPSFEYPTRSPFHATAVPGAAYSPVSKAEAGLSDLQLTRTAKSDELAFKGLARTQGTFSASKFVVSGVLSLSTGKVSGVTITWRP